MLSATKANPKPIQTSLVSDDGQNRAKTDFRKKDTICHLAPIIICQNQVNNQRDQQEEDLHYDTYLYAGRKDMVNFNHKTGAKRKLRIRDTNFWKQSTGLQSKALTELMRR